MSRERAQLTQAAIARAIRAAKQAGARSVEIPGGIVVRLAPEDDATKIPENSPLNEWLAKQDHLR